MRQIDITFPSSMSHRVSGVLSRSRARHWRLDNELLDGTQTAHVTAPTGYGQTILDDLQTCLTGTREWQITVLPIEASLTESSENTSARGAERKAAGKKGPNTFREELKQDIEKEAKLTRQFLVLTVLSTIVATIGLNTDSLTAVIGAMVIAPLLGPNLALTFSATIGDAGLLRRSLMTNGVGVFLSVGLAIAIGITFGVNMESEEFLARSQISSASVALALASGAAASLSLVGGLSSALVGVMVAVALLPPATAIGLFLGGGEVESAWMAGKLLMINIVCMNLAAQAVFFIEGVRPPPFLQPRKVEPTFLILLAFWTILLALLLTSIGLLSPGQTIIPSR